MDIIILNISLNFWVMIIFDNTIIFPIKIIKHKWTLTLTTFIMISPVLLIIFIIVIRFRLWINRFFKLWTWICVKFIDFFDCFNMWFIFLCIYLTSIDWRVWLVLGFVIFWFSRLVLRFIIGVWMFICHFIIIFRFIFVILFFLKVWNFVLI